MLAQTVHGYPIIARKPRGREYGGPEAEIILVDRGTAHMGRYVTAVFTPQTALGDEWLWGNYHRELPEAQRDFDRRR